MNVHLHIERLVLDGLPVVAAAGSTVRAGVEAELTRLIAEEGLTPALLRGGSLAYVRGANVALPPAPDPGALGRQIGEAVHEGLGAGQHGYRTGRDDSPHHRGHRHEDRDANRVATMNGPTADAKEAPMESEVGL